MKKQEKNQQAKMWSTKPGSRLTGSQMAKS